MSSIMEKGKLPTKMFLRSNSFQKLCSLAHPMRLRGFKSNKEALKSVFESLIVTTRGVIQSVTYRILCFLFLTPFTKLLSRPLQGIVDAVATTVASAAAASTATEANPGKDGDGDAKNRLNTVRLILKLTLSMIVSTDKPTDASCDNEPKLSEVSPTEDVDDEGATYKDVLAAGECPRTTVDTAVQTDDDDQEPPQEFFDCKEPPTDCKSLESSSLLRKLQQPRPRRPPRPSPAALVAIYGCVLGCVLQLSTLVYLLSGDAVRFPPGLIFLILALAYIGFVMTRIFTASSSSPSRKMASKKKDDCGNSATSKAVVALPEGVIRKQSSSLSSFGFAKGLHPVLAAVSKRIVATLLQQQNQQKSSATPPRMSRSATRTRMLLCADDKTISKVKIL